jgi:GNAT superfamily N-acetyltransferase
MNLELTLTPQSDSTVTSRVTPYTFGVENGAENYPELEPLYRRHYGEMQKRLREEGIRVGDFNMRLDVYMDRWRAGSLINYVARKGRAAVGYANMYLTSSMHNREFIAKEDAIYVLPEHRNGTGRRLAKFVLADLKARGALRLDVLAQTDPRAVKLWQRLGARPVAVAMSFTL